MQKAPHKINTQKMNTQYLLVIADAHRKLMEKKKEGEIQRDT
jgi:hypothetical protein